MSKKNLKGLGLSILIFAGSALSVSANASSMLSEFALKSYIQIRHPVKTVTAEPTDVG